MRAYDYHPQIHECFFVNQFASVLGMPMNTLHAKRILCAFFQTFREHIPLFASKSLIAHLPKDVRPFYKEGWQNHFSTKFDYDTFVDDLYTMKGMDHVKLFRSRREAETAVSAVFEVIRERSTDEEYEDLMSLMPLVLRINLLHDFHFDGHSYIS